MKRWVTPESLTQQCTLQKSYPGGLSGVLRACLGAYRLHRAIDMLLADPSARAQAEEALAKCDTSKWFSLEGTLQVADRQRHLNVDDPYTNTCVAAYKQLKDLQMLLHNPPDDALEKIRVRHATYTEAQV